MTRRSGKRSWGVVIAVGLCCAVAAWQWPRIEPWGEKHLGSWVGGIGPWVEAKAGPVLKLVGLGGADPAAKQTADSKATGGQAPQGKGPAPVPVTTTLAKTGDFPVVLSGLGTVEAYNSVLVRSRVDGQITKLHFKEGDLVDKGDILVEIDPRPYRAALEQAQAKKQQDDANLSNSRRDLDRYQSLAKSDYATRQQLDTQTSQVAQLTAQIAADQAAIDNAQTQLDYTTIRAPLKGRVGFRLIDEGNIVNASSTTGIVEINQIKPIAVIFTAAEDTLPQITAGLNRGPLPVDALSTDGREVYEHGRLEVFNNQVDAASGTIRLKAAFENDEKKLWPGLSVSTKMTVDTKRGVVLIPDTAVMRGQKGFYCFVVGPDGKAQMRNLKIGMMDQVQALIEDGVKDGETVVTSGQYRLAPGVAVKATAAPGAEQTASAAESSQ